MPAEDPDERTSEAGRGPLPDPLDRLWLHPTELFSRARAVAGGPGIAADPNRGLAWGQLALAAALGALATVLFLAVTGTLSDESSTSITPDTTPPSVTPGELAAAVAPSLVTVLVGDPAAGSRASGVVTRSGYVLTSAGAVAAGVSVAVRGADGTTHRAAVVGHDPLTDLALLEVDAVLAVPEMADADGLAAGHSAIAVGGGATWMSTGVVAALDRSTIGPDGSWLAGLIETDHAIGVAAAGGALLDENGAVVGILLAGTGTRPGYAVPIDVAADVANQLRTTGRATHGWLGITGAPDAVPGRGTIVATVASQSPGADAGLAAGDLVTEVDGEPVADLAALTAEVRRREPGDRVALTIERGGEEHRLVAEMAEPAPSPPDSPPAPPGTV